MLFAIAAISSCNLIPWEDLTENMNKDIDTFTKSKIYKGGNVDCSQVADEYPQLNLMQTTGRNDYDPSTDSFAFGWPAGLAVKVMDDGSVSFQIDGAIDLGDGLCYKIGAVIVKGSTASNIYTYPGGAIQDIGLVAPDNASGTPAGLSNLTFCFIECEEEEEVLIAVKSWYWMSEESRINKVWSDYNYTMSTSPAGFYEFTTGKWCDLLGINYYPGTTSFPLTNDTGTVTVEEGWPEGVHSLIITVDLVDGLVFDFTSIYVGDLQGLKETLDADGCPIYSSWPYKNTLNTNTHTFTIPF